MAAWVNTREPQQAELVLLIRTAIGGWSPRAVEAIELREMIHILLTMRDLPKLIAAAGVAADRRCRTNGF